MNRPTLALCMIVKNEEHHLPRLFETFKDAFDEIHITDTGSTDKTVEIAKNLGANVHHFDWCNDFSKARNYSFSHTTADFIMWLDADDELLSLDAFKYWRDNMMATADYWVARYDYSTEEKTGRTMCSFVRERVIRRDKGMQWLYPIHEGIVPISPFGEVRQSFIPTWAVKHVRTASDLEKDKARNLSIFQSMGTTLDARMRYYYGKELFEAGRHAEATIELIKAIAEPKMELHDRVLALQYACYAYMACNQFERVIDMAHSGLMLAPNRAEFYCVLGDAYLKLGKLSDAVPIFTAAKSCIKPPDNAPSAIFYHPDSYVAYPSNQLARIYANLGDLDRAYLETKTLLEKVDSEEARAVQRDIVNIKAIASAYKTANPCEDIVMSCPPGQPYKWDPLLAKTQHIGGSETAVMEMAKHLATHSGKPVKVFQDRDRGATIDGVEYVPFSELSKYMAAHKPYLHIAWRHNFKITEAPTFVWCHDLSVPGIENTENYTRVMALSEFHKKYMKAMFGVPDEKIYVTSNGIKPERFKSEVVQKNPNKIIFSSSPDRGLIRVMRVLDRVRETHPVELHVFYGMEQLPKYGKQDLYNELKAMFSERPWVKYHGGVDQDRLMSEMQDSAIWLYPTDFMETSCITALEMIGNGVYPIVRDYGALPYTLKEAHDSQMAEVHDMDCATEAEYEMWAMRVEKAISEKAWERVKINMDNYGWEKVAIQWLEDLPLMAYGESDRRSCSR